MKTTKTTTKYQATYDFDEALSNKQVKPLSTCKLKRLIKDRDKATEATKAIMDSTQNLPKEALRKLTRIQADGDRALSTLLNQYKPLIYKVLKDLHAKTTHNNKELFQAGWSGLSKALTKFDLTLGKIENYAYFYIRQEIINQFDIDNNMVKIPKDIYMDNKSIMEIEDDYIAEHQKHMPASLLLEKLAEKGIDKCRMQQQLELTGKTSYNVPADPMNKNSDEVAECLRDDSDYANTEKRALINIDVKKLLTLIKSLSYDDKTLICQIYGIGTKPLSQAEIASARHVSSAAISNRKRRILHRLRREMTG